jgi:hypothetical protein
LPEIAHLDRARSATGCSISVSCTCPIISDSTTLARKPPPFLTMRAAFEAAAITLGSSTTIGTSRSTPFTLTLSATPNGKP